MATRQADWSGQVILIPETVWIFASGMLELWSPCALAVWPFYLAWLSVELTDQQGRTGRKQTSRLNQGLIKITAFSLGFVAVFFLVGLPWDATFGIKVDYVFRDIRILLGVLIFYWGIGISGLTNSKYFARIFCSDKLKKFRTAVQELQVGPANFFLAGAGVSLAWKPCPGPVLNALLLNLGGPSLINPGASLWLIYSLGLAPQLVIFGLAWEVFNSRGADRPPRVPRSWAGGLIALYGSLIIFNLVNLAGAAAESIF